MKNPLWIYFVQKHNLNLGRKVKVLSERRVSMSWLKKKYSGIFTNNMFSSANEETADFIRIRTVLSLSAISFCLLWFVSHDFNCYHLFRKVDYFAEFVENYHNKYDVFSSSCTSFSVFFSKDSSWDSLFLLLDRCLMIIKLLL